METEEAMEVAKAYSDRYFKSLPPGIRFRPTDEELVGYLKKKVLKEQMPLHRIKTCNIYRYHPNEICRPDDVAREKERYFFTTTVKKYPNGGRPDRKAGDGYWKATGKDLPIKCKGEEVVGSKKTLVYYEGKQKDISLRKTNWIMHEYRIRRDIIRPVAKGQGDNNNKNNNILDECVLAKIYEKTTSSKKPAETTSSPSHQQILDSEQLPPEEQDNPILEPEEYPTAEQVAAPPPYPYHQNPMEEAAAAAYHGYNTNMMIRGSEQLSLPPPEAQANPILEPEEYPTARQAAAAPPYPNHQNPMSEATVAAYNGYNTYMMIPVSEQLPLPQPEAQDNPILEPEEYHYMAQQVAELPPFPYQENPMDEAAATFYSWGVGSCGFESLQTDENCYGFNSGAFSFEEDNGFRGSLNGGLEDVVAMYTGNNANPSATRHGPANVSHKQKKEKE